MIVIGGGAAILVGRGRDNNSFKLINTATGASQEVKSGTDAYIAVDSCNVLTESIAVQVVGAGAVKGNTSAGNVSNSDLSVSNCVYTLSPASGAVLEKANNTKVASVLVRAPKTKAGADSNKAIFSSSKPAGVQDVSGVGDKAFFNPKFGQLNVLKGSNDYIVTSHTGGALSGTLETDKKLSDVLTYK